MIYTFEQLLVAQVSPELRAALIPLHSLGDVEEVLKVRGLSFGWRRVEVNSAGMQPDFARKLAALPPHEVFIVPQGQGAVIATIVQQRPAPPGAAAAAPPARPKP